MAERLHEDAFSVNPWLAGASNCTGHPVKRISPTPASVLGKRPLRSYNISIRNLLGMEPIEK